MREILEKVPHIFTHLQIFLTLMFVASFTEEFQNRKNKAYKKLKHLRQSFKI